MEKQNHFIIFSAGLNCEQWLDKHLSSVRGQTYTNYTHILVDDCSTDSTHESLLRTKDDKTLIYRTSVNQEWLANSVEFLEPNIHDPESIVAVLDMDDWFSHDRVLERMNEVYNENDCWLTYSKLQRSNKNVPDNVPPYSEKELETRAYRTLGWRLMSLKTFKAFLYRNINKDDFKWLSDRYSKWAYDIALYMPMLDMCPPKKIVFVPEVFYIYNLGNPLSVINRSREVIDKRFAAEAFFKAKPQYPRYEKKITDESKTEIVRAEEVPSPESEKKEPVSLLIYSYGFDCASVVEKHIRSVHNQTFDCDYLHVMVNDASSDNTEANISKHLEKFANAKVKVYTTNERLGWIGCLEKYVLPELKQNRYVAFVDMYDRFSSSNVVKIITDLITETYIDALYGKYLNEDETIPVINDHYSPSMVKKCNYRSSTFRFTPLRVVNGNLVKQVFDSYKTSMMIANKYPTTGYEFTFFVPLLELTNPDRVYHCNEVLYIQGSTNPEQVGTDFKTSNPARHRVETYMRKQPRCQDYRIVDSTTKKQTVELKNIGSEYAVCVPNDPGNSRLVILSMGRNTKEYLGSHFSSIKSQTYRNFLHLYIDDCSDDGTSELLGSYKDTNTTIIVNPVRKYMLRNVVEHLAPVVQDNDIVLQVDADDWLPHDKVFDVVNNYYKLHDCWISGSNCLRTDGRITGVAGYSKDVVRDRDYRLAGLRMKPLRAWRGWLFKKIRLDEFKDLDTKYLRAWVQAILYPMLEMSPPIKIAYIPEVLYVYNVNNPLNGFKNYKKETDEASVYFSSLPKYDLLQLPEERQV